MSTVASGARYFLSDLHFTSVAEPRCQRLIDFLASLRDAEAIYLVGDVFDFWLGYRRTLYRDHFPLLRTLADLTDAGVRVLVFSGNHDPDPGDFFSEIGVEVSEGPRVEQMGRFTVRMEHGDTIDPRGVLRRTLCKAVRHPVARRAARFIPPAALWSLANAYALKPHGDYGPGLPAGLTRDYFPAQVEAGVDVLIMGHYHRAVHHRRGDARYFVLGDWRAQFTYLLYVDGDFKLMRQRLDGPAQALPEGDWAP